MRLDLGSGKYPIEGYIHFDRYVYPDLDCIGDANALPFRSGSFDEVVASHIIEHIPWWETRVFLQEWYRVIREGGFIDIQTVDFEQICHRYLDRTGMHYMSSLNPDGIHGIWLNRAILWWEESTERIENLHRAVFDFRYLVHCLAQVGFRDVIRLPIEQTKTYKHHVSEMLARGYK